MEITEVEKLLNKDCNTNDKSKIKKFLTNLSFKVKDIRGANHCLPVLGINIDDKTYCVLCKQKKNAGFKFRLVELSEYNAISKASKLNKIFTPNGSGNYKKW